MTSMRQLQYYRLTIGILGTAGAFIIATHPRADLNEFALASLLVVTGAAIIATTLWELHVVANGGTAG